MILRRGGWTATALFLMAAIITVAVRAAGIGDIVAHADEQYYLLVGDRMLHWGATPYVDIWDRKPVGLFLLYAGIRLLGGDGIVQYQLVAMLAVAATSGIMAVWIARFSGWPGAVAGVMLYNGLLVSHLGFGGQAEVFLNLAVVGAGWLAHGLLLSTPSQKRLALVGGAAMLLCGLAIQVKPTALLPGVFAGLTLLWAAGRSGVGWGRLAGLGALWVGLALLPTLLVVLYYGVRGLLDPWLFANILSIFDKAPDRSGAVAQRIADTWREFGRPFMIAAAVALGQCIFRRDRRLWISTLFLLGWLLSGVAAFAVLSAAYPHYALVMAPMGCLIVGYAARCKLPGFAMLAYVLNLSLNFMGLYERRLQDNARIAPQIRHMAEAVAPYIDERRCLYVYHGPVILYTLTRACIPTRFAFPNHLSIRTEASGLGVDPAVEVRRILSTPPAVIVDGVFGFHQPNVATQRLVQVALKQDYRPIAAVRDRDGRMIATAYARQAAMGSSRPLR